MMRAAHPSDVASEHWDVVVVGTGVGGATLGYALARSGWRVLFCEMGRARRADDYVGEYAESFFDTPAYAGPQHAGTLLRAGRYAKPIEDVSGSRRLFVPFVGCGTGGSSALYGMAMERFFPADFQPQRNHPREAGANLPEAWPIAYDELAPYYAAAERLYRVRGAPDPLRSDKPELMPAPSFSAAALALAKHFETRGLHPYRLPSACEYVEGCQSCQGYLCPRDCKNDSARVCLEPALKHHGAELMDCCEVVRLRASKHAVQTVECRWHGKPVTVRGRVVVLAAGALATPVILLKSASDDWPNGLANDSGLVGRNLMRHLVDLYAIESEEERVFDNRLKEIGLNDFYLHRGLKLGSVQSFGRLPPVDVVLQSLLQDIRGSSFWMALPLAKLALPTLRSRLTALIDRSFALASIVEDLPYPHNRVELSDTARSGIRIHYRPGVYERDRIKLFRRVLQETLKPLRFRLIAQADKNERIAHACGTCRFGDDPLKSVLDQTCRGHGLENLYVVDSSFFPTSAGTNPALTIAANALRVSSILGATYPLGVCAKEVS